MGSKKTLAALFAELLEQPLEAQAAQGLADALRCAGIGISNGEAIAMAQILKAMKGDTAAAKYIAETLKGEAGSEPCEITLRVVR